jgi:hypothetical protein
MTNRDDEPAVNGHARFLDVPARNLRDKLAGIRSSGVRRDRFHFRSLKRLCLPPRDLAPRLAPNL